MQKYVWVVCTGLKSTKQRYA